MSPRARDIIVGLTGITGVLGVGFLMMLFGYAPAWLQEGYQVTLTMPHASGLRAGSRVRMSGKDIGRIASVDLRGPPDWGVVVVAKIDVEHDVPTDAAISVEAPILGGSPALGLEPRRGVAGAAFLAKDGTARLAITEPIPSLASRFAAELRSALKATVADLRSELSRAQGNLDRLSTAWIEVADHLSDLLEPRSPGTVDAAAPGEMMANLSTVVARADERLVALQSVLDGLSTWVNDDALRDQVGDLATNANALAVKLDGGVDRVTEIAAGAAASFDALVVALVAVSDELSGAIGNARAVLAKVSDGEGTASRMVNDPALYESMQDAFERLDLALEEMRMLVEKWQREGLPVKF